MQPKYLLALMIKVLQPDNLVRSNPCILHWRRQSKKPPYFNVRRKWVRAAMLSHQLTALIALKFDTDFETPLMM